MLNREEIRVLNIIQDSGDTSFRAASYDIRIGRIVAVGPKNSSEVKEAGSYVLKPQGMVEVISWETVKLPAEIAGYASVKTTLSREGLLALNTGIIDPGYHGPLSAAVVNFGKTHATLKRGQTFLRLTFHRLERLSDFNFPEPVTREKFLEDRKEAVETYFSSSFLAISEHSEEIVRSVLWRSLVPLLVVVPTIGLLVALVTFGGTLGVAHWQAGFLSKDQVRASVDEYFQSDDFKSLKSEMSAIQKEELTRQVRTAVKAFLEEEHARPVEEGGIQKSRQPKERARKAR